MVGHLDTMYVVHIRYVIHAMYAEHVLNSAYLIMNLLSNSANYFSRIKNT